MRTELPGRPTDDRLLDVAIDQFGRKGLEGASTRAIAAAAGTAMSSITYHYGGKEGLYVATARHIAAQIRTRFAAVMANAPHAADLEPEVATEQILVMAGAFLQVMLSAEAAPWARFIVREQMEPTEAFEVLWSEVMSPVSSRLVALVLRAGAGRWTETEVRIRTVTLIGQILVFRVARATALRVTGWDDIGPRRAADHSPHHPRQRPRDSRVTRGDQS